MERKRNRHAGQAMIELALLLLLLSLIAVGSSAAVARQLRLIFAEISCVLSEDPSIQTVCDEQAGDALAAPADDTRRLATVPLSGKTAGETDGVAPRQSGHCAPGALMLACGPTGLTGWVWVLLGAAALLLRVQRIRSSARKRRQLLRQNAPLEGAFAYPSHSQH